MGVEVGGFLIGALGVAGAVLTWLVRIEHRLTQLETTIVERLPRTTDRLACRVRDPS